MTDAPANPLLSTRGHVYVTLAAARTYLEQTDSKTLADLTLDRAAIEEARRDLTELLVTKGRIRGASEHDLSVEFRARDIGARIDVQGSASIEWPLVVITRVHVRTATDETKAERQARRNARRIVR